MDPIEIEAMVQSAYHNSDDTYSFNVQPINGSGVGGNLQLTFPDGEKFGMTKSYKITIEEVIPA